MELLHDRGGRDDIYRLAEPLAMDVDDLLPIIEAATMLGFATLKEGDVELTREGIAFAEADILTRKVLFRDAALKHIAFCNVSTACCAASRTTPFRKNSFTTFWMNTSARMKSNANLKLPQLGPLRRNLRL